jgi:hypothetical protein
MYIIIIIDILRTSEDKKAFFCDFTHVYYYHNSFRYELKAENF